MSYKVIVHTSKGGSSGSPDSLLQPVKIAFTLTPVETKQPTALYNPVVRWVKDFAMNSQSDQMVSVEWGLELAYSAYEVKARNDRRYCDIELPGNYAAVGLCGQSRALTSPPNNKRMAMWTAGTPYVDYVAFRQGSVMAVNETGQTQNLALLIKDSGNSNNYEAIAAYHPLGHGARCVTPSELRLQAYVVTDPRILVNHILFPQDMTQPLFPIPLSCDSLHASSIWRLWQDGNRTIRLTNESEPELGFGSTDAKLDALARSIADLRNHLTSVENSVNRAQNDFTSGQQAITDVRNQLAVIQRSANQPPAYAPAQSSPITSQKQSPSADARVPALEAKTEQLSKSFEQTQEYLSSVQKFLQNTRLQVSGLDRKIPTIESKADKLAETVGSTKEELSAVQESFLATQNQLEGFGQRVAAVEAKSGKLEESLEEVRDLVTSLSGDESQILFASRTLDTMSLANTPSPLASFHSLDDELPRLPTFGRS